MKRLYLMRRGSGMMRIGRYPNGGGRVGGEAWIDGDKCTGVDNAGGSMYL